MANQIGRFARMYLDDLDVYLRSFEMETGIESVTADATKYGDDWEVAEVVQGKGRITINSYLDDVYKQGPPADPPGLVNNSLDLLMWKMLTNDATPPTIFQTPAILTFIPFDTPVNDDNGVLFMQGFGQFSIAPQVKGLVPIRTQIVGAGPLNRGKIIALGTTTAITSAAPFVSTPVAQFVGGAPTKFIRAALHVFSFALSAGTPTLTCTLESDDAVGFPSEITRLTFPTFTTLTGAYVEQTLVDTDEFYRVRITSDDAVNASTLGFIVVAYTE